MIPTEKLGAACFSENIQLLGDIQRHKEKGNLYNGLRAMAETLEALTHAIRRIDQRLDLIDKNLKNRP